MTTSTLEGEGYFQLNSVLYQEQTNRVIDPILKELDKIVTLDFKISCFFFTILAIECVLLGSFFTFLLQSSYFAFTLAGIVLTIFSYFMIRQYLESQKTEKLEQVKQKYVEGCQNFLHYQEGFLEHHIAIANACSKLADKLHGREYTYFLPPRWLNFLTQFLEKISCWYHWKLLFQMKELLLLTSLEEHIKLVKCEPTHLEVHAALANAYVMLSGLYMDPRKLEGYEEDQWIPPNKYTKEVEEKFQKAAKKAIEEFKILNDYAPNDPWVHAQLAYSYHDLMMFKEEMEEYETLLKLRPNDLDSLFKLGVLYFQQGQNAQGLKIYEELRKAHFKKAEVLMDHYGK